MLSYHIFFLNVCIDPFGQMAEIQAPEKEYILIQPLFIQDSPI